MKNQKSVIYKINTKSYLERLISHPYIVLAFFCMASLITVSPFVSSDHINNIRIGYFIFSSVFVYLVLTVLYCLDAAKIKLKNILCFTVLYILINFAFIMLAQVKYNVFILMIYCYLLIIALGIYLFIKKKLSCKTTCILIFALSFILRLGYISYTLCVERQHDVAGQFPYGHFDYINLFLKNGFTLPPNYENQFYHPPLHHFLAAVWIKLQLIAGISRMTAIENLQILTLFYSSASTVIIYKILNELGFKGKSLILGFAVICFHPTFIFLSGSVNNDILAFLFICLLILYTIRWFKNPSRFNIAVIAVCFGLGMLTKSTVAIMAVPIAFVFIYKFIKSNQKKDLTLKYIMFIVIAAPISLSFSVIQHFRISMPFGYLSTSSSELSIYTAFERLFTVNIHHLSIYHTPLDIYNYNIFYAALKSSVFGEYQIFKSGIGYNLSALLLAVNILLATIAVIAGIYVIVTMFNKTNKKQIPIIIFLSVLYLTNMSLFIRYCLLAPAVCTEDFRYIVATLIVGVAFICYALNILKEKNTKLSKLTVRSIAFLVILFCVLSATVYTLYALQVNPTTVNFFF